MFGALWRFQITYLRQEGELYASMGRLESWEPVRRPLPLRDALMGSQPGLPTLSTDMPLAQNQSRHTSPHLITC